MVVARGHLLKKSFFPSSTCFSFSFLSFLSRFACLIFIRFSFAKFLGLIPFAICITMNAFGIQNLLQCCCFFTIYILLSLSLSLHYLSSITVFKFEKKFKNSKIDRNPKYRGIARSPFVHVPADNATVHPFKRKLQNTNLKA